MLGNGSAGMNPEKLPVLTAQLNRMSYTGRNDQKVARLQADGSIFGSQASRTTQSEQEVGKSATFSSDNAVLIAERAPAGER
jgi:hypothetical protein